MEEELLTTQVEPELQPKDVTEETELTTLTADVAEAVVQQTMDQTELLLLEEPEEPEETEHLHLLIHQQRHEQAAVEVAAVTPAEAADPVDLEAAELETVVTQVVMDKQTLVVVADLFLETVPEDTVVQGFV